MDDDPIPISLVANYMFCPRRAWLEAVGEKVDSDQIMRGTYDHRKVDRTGGAPDADSFQAVNIRHEEWGVVVPEKLRTLDHGRPWSDDQFASTRLSSNRDMSR